MDTNTQQIIDRLERIETKLDTAVQQHADMRVEVALLKRESDNRRTKNFIHYGVILVLSIIGGWFGFHVSLPVK